MEEKQKHAPIPKRIKEITLLLEPHGIDFNQFLKQLNKYHRNNTRKLDQTYQRIKKKKKFAEKMGKIRKNIIQRYFRKQKYCYFINPKIGAKFKIICYQDRINAIRLIEAFMNAYIESEPSLVEFMKFVSNYHEKRIFRSTTTNFNERITRMRKIFQFYNLPIEWWKKYTDLKSDEVM